MERMWHILGFGGLVFFVLALPSWGDGCLVTISESWLAPQQTRQEVILAVHGGEVTYVLRSRYKGRSDQMAWVIPVPSTPTQVKTPKDGQVFDRLDELTRPRFVKQHVSQPSPLWFLLFPWMGFPCSAKAQIAEVGQVKVEACGQAGIFDWAALTSTGRQGLMHWLQINHFPVAPGTGPIFDHYIQQGMHFLALRVRDQQRGNGAETEIPPIEFTCRTTKIVYPMLISRVSAARKTEVVIYLLGAHPERLANVPNVIIDPAKVREDWFAKSRTNYERLFSDAIKKNGGLAGVVEHASRFPDPRASGRSSELPPELTRTAKYLTRIRTIIPKDRMTEDFEFQEAPDSLDVHSWFGL